MTDIQLAAQRRERVGKRVNALRRAGRIPAVVYGHGSPTVVCDVPEVAFQHVWHAAGESSLIDLRIGDDAPVKAIIQDVQQEPASGKVLHVDFHQVNMKEKIDVDVELRFIGEAPAVKEQGGTLIKERSSIAVECLPKDLVKEIDVDVSTLVNFETVLRVRDIPLPPGLTLRVGPDEICASVEAPRTEEELAQLDKVVEEDVTRVEKIEKPKEKEEGEPEPDKETPNDTASEK